MTLFRKPTALSVLTVVGVLLVGNAVWADRADFVGLWHGADVATQLDTHDWREFFTGILTSATALFAVTVAVLGLAQRRDPSPDASMPRLGIAVATAIFAARIGVATSAMLFAGGALAAIALIPHLTTARLELFSSLVWLAQFTFIAVFVLTSNDINRTVERINAALDIEPARALRRERNRLVEALLPHLESRYAVSTLNDVMRPLPLDDIPLEFREKVTVHEAKRQPLIALLHDALATGKEDLPFLRELQRVVPERIGAVALSIGVLAPWAVFMHPTVPVVAFGACIATFGAMLYASLSVLAFTRANAARALREPRADPWEEFRRSS